jgi:lipid-binding SYLF domain-containing protein
MKRASVIGLLLAASGVIAACAHVPKSEAKRQELVAEAEQTIQEMTARDPTLQTVLQNAAGYIVFPNVKQGGALVGGAGGSGVLFEAGQQTGFADLNQASIGAQLGGQKFAQIVVLRDRAALDRIKSGTFDMGGQASATMIKAGAASATQFGANGIAVFVQPKGGAMVNLSLTGQKIRVTM